MWWALFVPLAVIVVAVALERLETVLLGRQRSVDLPRPELEAPSPSQTDGGFVTWIPDADDCRAATDGRAEDTGARDRDASSAEPRRSGP